MAESKAHRNARLKALRKKHKLGEYGPKRSASRVRKRSKSKSKSRKRSTTRGNSMAKKGKYTRRRSSSGFSLSRLTSTKNLMYTGAAILFGAAALNVDPKIAGAIGGFLGAGVPGAVVGYVAAPIVSNATSQFTGGASPTGKLF